MGFRVVYCANCDRVLGRYNTEFYDEDRLGEILKTGHSEHVREGHEIEIRTG
ncbi:MAG: hypothetical protein MPI95_07365 [Nitrosopumilus sp.]|nr:hypothetical protein [Nitrosopumilus sp.]CAI9831757.1 conserved hypothetical protein [Nitrosopumilaceae archaeon]MDA7940989.1 hypothetical protein [Nitrosopumilus sp.]MDA7942613.1 hypothetical protein [Nitrosopumilus sp.]MDA7944419.1 hypothetical protein [Nitrosopumilus sp.]